LIRILYRKNQAVTKLLHNGIADVESKYVELLYFSWCKYRLTVIQYAILNIGANNSSRSGVFFGRSY